MKAKKQDRNLREFFRQKLENAEVIPDPQVGIKLMRNLAVREFLHFNPFRFNIYYLGGIIVAGIAAALIVTSVSDREDTPSPEKSLNEIPVRDNNELIIPAAPVIMGKEDIIESRAATHDAGIPGIGMEPVKAVEKIPVTVSGSMYSTTPDKINGTMKGKDFFEQVKDGGYIHKGKADIKENIIESSVTEGCAPLKVVFRIKLNNCDSCQWIFGDGGSSGNKEAEWIYDIEGEYIVTLKVFGSDGIVESSNALISVFPKPSARFEISPDKPVLPDDEIRFQNYSAGAVRYSWSFGDGNTSELFEPLHKYDKFGNYNVSLTAYSEKGCFDSLRVINAFSGSEYYIDFPNAFIPNPAGPSGGVYSSTSDESARVFHPSYSGVSEYHLKIFSKLGILLFETNDISIGWDGYFKGQLSNPGVYVWKVRGKFRNGEPFTRMGDITLLKN